MRFVVVCDRYDSKYPKRSIEDLKERFYTVMRRLLHLKQDKTHPLYSYKYDSEYDK
jgi:hypothetical protein